MKGFLASAPTISGGVWRIATAAIGAVILLAAVLWWQLGRYTEMRDAVARTESIRFELRELGEDLLGAENREQTYLITQIVPAPDEFDRMARTTAGRLDRMRALMSDEEARRTLDRLRPLVDDRLAQLGATMSLLHDGNVDDALAIFLGGRGRRLMEEIEQLRGELLTEEARLLDERRAGVEVGFRWVLLTVVVGGVLGICAVLFFSVRATRQLGAPIAALLAGLRAMASGQLEHRVAVSSRDEIGQIAEAFNRMAADLEAARDARDAARVEVQRGHEALAQSERRLSHVTGSLPAVISYIDADLRFVFVNRAFAEWYRIDGASVIGRRVDEVFVNEYPNVVGYIEVALRGETVQYEREIVTAGRRRHVQAALVPSRDEAGRLVGFVAMATDVSALKQSEQALQALNREQQAILESELLGMAKVRDRHFCWISPALERMLGYDVGDLAGRPTRCCFTDDESWANQGAHGYPLIRAGATYRTEQWLVKRDGQPICVDMTGVMFDRQQAESLWLFTDITARKLAEEALRSSNDLLERTGALAGVGGWELDLATGAIVWSDEACRLHDVERGHRPTMEEAVGYYVPEHRPEIQRAVQACIENGTPFDLELQLVSRLGRRFWGRAVGTAEFENGRVVRLAGAFQDVTERRRIERELAESHELLQVTLESIGDAVITTDHDGVVQWLNPVAERLTGWPKAGARGQRLSSVFTIVNEETRATAPDPVARCLAEGRIVGLANHTVLVSRDGTEFGIEDSAAPIRDASGQVLGAVLVFRDVSAQRNLSREMSYRATHDALTGLANRAEFETRLARLLQHLQPEADPHALLYLDLDRFKLVNDVCGHAAGDQLLRQVSALLQSSVRGRDTVARLGGDEFGIILEHCDTDQALRVAQSICQQMDEYRFLHEGRRFSIGASIGLVPVDMRWGTMAGLLQAADSSCYAAKEAGRNRVHVWFDSDDAMRTRQGEMHWVNRLEQAIDDGDLMLYGQIITPIRGSTDGLHCEVLLRLREADGTVVLPGAFLPAAERFHFIPRVDRWVVGKVFEWMQSIGEASSRIDCISVNLSGQSIGDRAFHRHVVDMIERSTFDMRKICFEITETAAITNLADAKLFIDEVRALGCRIALDDFGAGASSFGYLKNLPVDFIKIDGQFVCDLLDDPLDNAAVRCFCEVAEVVGVDTIAEFVERAEVYEELRAMGVDMAQGFLLHRPEPLVALLEKRRLETQVG